MQIPSTPVNRWVEPTLFPPQALAVHLECLVDTLDETVVVSLIATEPISGKLHTLVSGPALPYESFEARVRELGKQMTELLREFTSPFP